MFSASVIDRSTIQAYQETHYRVLENTPMALRVGVANPSLAALYKDLRTDCSVFITACNPFSQTLDDATNADRQAKLALELRQRSLTFFAGIGEHPSGNWRGEASFLVLGLALDAAKDLGNRHQQNAIIWCGPDALPQLVLLR